MTYKIERVLAGRYGNPTVAVQHLVCGVGDEKDFTRDRNFSRLNPAFFHVGARIIVAAWLEETSDGLYHFVNDQGPSAVFAEGALDEVVERLRTFHE